MKNELGALEGNKEQRERQSILDKGMAGKVSLAIENIYSKVQNSRKLPSKQEQKNVPSKQEHRNAPEQKETIGPIQMIKKTYERLEDLKVITGELTEEQIDQAKTHNEEPAAKNS